MISKAHAIIINPAVNEEIGVVNSTRTSGSILKNIRDDIIGAIMAVGALLLLVYLIWGAFDWITSAGDSGKISTARNKMVFAVIGLLILASTFAIFVVIDNFLGANFVETLFSN